jgi:hypothetical protein
MAIFGIKVIPVKKALLLLLVLVASCQKQEAALNERILGNWNFNRVTSRDTTFRHSQFSGSDKNYIFYPKNACDTKTGYILPIRDFKTGFAGSVYLGKRTHYQCKDSMLRIYDRSNLIWQSYKMMRLTENELTLKDDQNTTFLLKRYQPKIVDKNHYDAFIISQSPCFGSCPINYAMITNDGKFYYNGVMYNTSNEFYSTTIGKQKFRYFEDRFREMEIGRLQSAYRPELMATCGSSNYVSFIKDAKIYKTTSEYMDAFPVAINAPVEELSFLYQKVRVYDSQYLFDQNVVLSRFDNETDRFILEDTEGFYLAVLLNNSPICTEKFTPKYELSFFCWGKDSHELKKIETDGRYYRIISKDHVQIRDLGYDFVTRNKAELKPRE